MVLDMAKSLAFPLPLWRERRSKRFYKNKSPEEVSWGGSDSWKDKECAYSYIVDGAQQRLAGWKVDNLSLAGWKVDKLSLAGRVALCQSVIQALPLYTMQSAKSSKIYL